MSRSGVLSAIGILIFIHESRHAHREPFDFFGFTTLSVAIGALQMMLDRGELKDWFGSTEIWVEATIAGLALYLFVVHTATATDRSFLNRDLLKDANCIVGTVLMFLIGIPLYGTMTLLPTMLQDLLNYPVMTTGLVTAPRGIGTMVAMFLVARLVGRIDTRLIILTGLAVTAVAMWQMTGFSLTWGWGRSSPPGCCRALAWALSSRPLSIVTFSTLPRHLLTQGTAIFSLMRNIGGSVGIAIVVALLAENTQIVHSRLVEQLRPDNPLARAPHLAAPFSLTDPSGIAALNAEATRQAAMVAYIDNFKLMMLIVIVGLPLLLLLRNARSDGCRAAPPPRNSGGGVLDTSFSTVSPRPVIIVEADQVFDLLAQRGELVVADPGVAPGLRASRPVPAFMKWTPTPSSDLRVDAGSIAHPLQFGRARRWGGRRGCPGSAPKPAALSRGAAPPRPRRRLRGNSRPRSAPTSAAALTRPTASSRPSSRQVSERAMITKSGSVRSRSRQAQRILSTNSRDGTACATYL